MLIALVAAILAAQPMPKLAFGPVEVARVDEPSSGFFVNRLGQELSSRGALVITPDQATALLGLERQRQLLGCSDSECALELAGALGVQSLIIGRITGIEGVIQIDLKRVNAQDGSPIASWSGQVAGPRQVADIMAVAATALLGLPPERSKAPGIIVAALGVAAAGAGVALFVDAEAVHGQLVGAAALPSGVTGESLSKRGQLDQVLGVVGVGTGAAALAVGLVLLLMPTAQPARVAVVPTPSGIAVVGVLP